MPFSSLNNFPSIELVTLSKGIRQSHIANYMSWLSKSRSGSYDPKILRSHLPKTIQIFQGSLRSFRIDRIVRF